MIKLRKAVFPVAGFGTRFLPATKAMPKELLPIVDKPLIQYAAEEAIAAGIDTLIFVTGRNKRAIEDHFDNNQELEMALRAKGKNEQADMVKNIVQHQPILTTFPVRADSSAASVASRAAVASSGVPMVTSLPFSAQEAK